MKWQDIIIWILFLLSLTIVVWYFFGNSPTLEEAILVLLLTLILTTIIQAKENSYRLKSLEKSFHALAKDFKAHLNKNKH